MQCSICLKIYIGKTDTPLHKRVNGHCNSIVDSDSVILDAQALAHHAVARHNKKFNDIYKVWIVKNVVNPRALLKFELHYINEFGSKEPSGLNVENPQGIRIKRLKV